MIPLARNKTLAAALTLAGCCLLLYSVACRADSGVFQKYVIRTAHIVIREQIESRMLFMQVVSQDRPEILLDDTGEITMSPYAPGSCVIVANVTKTEQGRQWVLSGTRWYRKRTWYNAKDLKDTRICREAYSLLTDIYVHVEPLVKRAMNDDCMKMRDEEIQSVVLDQMKPFLKRHVANRVTSYTNKDIEGLESSEKEFGSEQAMKRLASHIGKQLSRDLYYSFSCERSAQRLKRGDKQPFPYTRFSFINDFFVSENDGELVFHLVGDCSCYQVDLFFRKENGVWIFYKEEVVSV